MTLDEAIIHYEELADGHDRIKQIKAVTLEECKCAYERRQLAEWLRELKAYKEQTDGDLISRQAVIDSLYALCDTGETLKENPWRDNPHIDALIETVEEMPSAEKTAEWKPLDKEKAQYYMFGYVCSKCGAPAKSPTKYCSNCGAKMHGGKPG